MSFDDLSSNNELQERTLHPTILSENRAIETDSETTTPTINEIDSTIFAFFFWIAFLSIISGVLFKVFHKLETVKVKRLSILPVSKIPCRNCKFFSNNQYLKCSVHPMTVLTAQAANCSDYCDKHKSDCQTDRNYFDKIN